MKKTIYQCIRMAVFMLPLMAFDCRDDFSDNKDIYYLGEDGMMHQSYLTTITKWEFKQQVMKKGWRLDSSHVIDSSDMTENTRANQCIETPLPHDLYFSEDSLFVFQYRQDENELMAKPYQYISTDNRIVNEIIPYIILTSVWKSNSKEAACIQTLEYVDDGECAPMFVSNIYIEMTNYELNSRWLSFKRKGNE